MIREMAACTWGGDHQKLAEDAVADRRRLNYPLEGLHVLCLQCRQKYAVFEN